jgi:hypothetical protein
LAALAALAACGAARAQWDPCGVAACTNPANQYLPVAASDNAGGTIVAWADQRTKTAFGTPRWMIYAQRFDNTGVPLWTVDGVQAAPDTVAADTTFDQEAPAILADGSGGAYIAWQDKHDSPFTDIFMQHLDSNGTPQWTVLDPQGAPSTALGGVGVSRAPFNQLSPVLVPDGAGGVIVIYQHSNGVNFDIYAQRVNPAGVLQWAANGLPVCTAANNQTRPRAVPDGAGGAFVVWQDERYISGTSGFTDVMAQRIDGNGVQQWKVVPQPGQILPDSLNGFPIYGVAGFEFTREQRVPELTLDGTGGVIVACEDARANLSYDITAQRLDGAGTQLWGFSGIIVSNATNDQRYPVLCSDGAGGAIVTWHDYRRGLNSDTDIFAQRVNALGAPQWTANGVSLCNQPGNQLYPSVVADGAGGAVVCWYDERGTTPNLYAQRVNSAGAAQFAANGVQICGTPYGPYAHSLIPDGTGGGIVAWQDGRTTNTDVYAARVSGSGGLTIVLAVENSAPNGLMLGPPSPNPTRREMSVAFVLPAGGPATLELLDVAGRLVEHHEVGGLGAGSHVLALGRATTLHAGLYFVRLRQGGRNLIAKATVIP